MHIQSLCTAPYYEGLLVNHVIRLEAACTYLHYKEIRVTTGASLVEHTTTKSETNSAFNIPLQTVMPVDDPQTLALPSASTLWTSLVQGLTESVGP